MDQKYLEKARELSDDSSFIKIILNEYPKEFFDGGYWRYFVRLKDKNELSSLLDEYNKVENKDLKLEKLTGKSLADLILYAYNRDERKLKKKELEENELEESVKNIKRSPEIKSDYLKQNKGPGNRSPSFGIYSQD